MKTLLALIALSFAGCQSAPVAAPLPVPPKTAPEPRPIAAIPPPPAQPPANSALERLEEKIRQQAQMIEALISQNDALTAKLAAVPPVSEQRQTPPTTSPPPPPAPLVSPAVEKPAPPVTPPAIPLPAAPLVLMPNADGVIDLAAAALAAPSGEPQNPFVVRAVPPESVREVSLHITGIVTGAVPCAVINDRLVQAGEMFDSFAVERIAADAVFLRRGEHQLRLPVAEKAARVRLPL